MSAIESPATGHHGPLSSGLAHWWWGLDRWSLAAAFGLIAIGALMVAAASPPVAERIGLHSFHFVQRQIVLLPVAVLLIIGLSMLNPRQIRRLSLLGCVGALALTAATLFIAPEHKGAQRWLYIGGFSLQPSELLKPTLLVVTAWLFTLTRTDPRFPGHVAATALTLTALVVLVLQPDFGMAALIAVVWGAQFFLAGLSVLWVGALMLTAVAGAFIAYVTVPHVASRIDRFLNPAAGDTYQIDRSLEAFGRGGLFGQGPGEGSVKMVLPDAHADFIFSVAGEEMGLIACLIIIGFYLFIVLRGLTRLTQERSLFPILAGGGLLLLFAGQALINMASAVGLIPTKGMTLPFISYGGSSLMGAAITLGLALSLTRRHHIQGAR